MGQERIKFSRVKLRAQNPMLLKWRHQGCGGMLLIDDVFEKISRNQRHQWRVVDKDGELVEAFFRDADLRVRVRPGHMGRKWEVVRPVGKPARTRLPR